LSGEKEMVDSVEKRVKDALAEIKPQLQADGGDVDFVAIVGSVVQVRLRGACAGCPMSTMTLKQGIERIIKAQVPEITRVDAVQ
jgi:Fe-S cluster biogenesis protein NfuA